MAALFDIKTVHGYMFHCLVRDLPIYIATRFRGTLNLMATAIRQAKSGRHKRCKQTMKDVWKKALLSFAPDSSGKTEKFFQSVHPFHNEFTRKANIPKRPKFELFIIKWM